METQKAAEKIPAEVEKILRRPMPAEALSQAPRSLTSIKSIYITERLNEAFGLGRWCVVSSVIEATPPMIVVHSSLTLLDYPWFSGESYGGNDNKDLGDAYKGAVSDAISKICAMYLGVAVDVYKGHGVEAAKQEVKRKSEQPDNQDSEPPIEAYADIVEEAPQQPQPVKKTNGKPAAGRNDAHGEDAITIGKAKRFKAIAKSNGKSWEDQEFAVTQAGLSTIEACPWRKVNGISLYDNLIAWAEKQ